MKIYVLDFDCDTDGGSESPTATDQDVSIRPYTALQTNLRSVSINCYLISLTDTHLNVYILH